MKRQRVLTLPYTVFRLDAGDLDRDGLLDLFAGVAKPCRFDSTTRKRLFIYTVEEGWIRSKWMGTYLANELLDFHVVKDAESTRVHTREQDGEALYQGIYAWGGFGPRLVSYTTEDTNE